MLSQIDLLRHGEPVGGRRYRGQIDDPLSDKGWEQMRKAVHGRTDWDAILHSPLLRCAEFAVELSAKLDIPVGSKYSCSLAMVVLEQSAQPFTTADRSVRAGC